MAPTVTTVTSTTCEVTITSPNLLSFGAGPATPTGSCAQYEGQYPTATVTPIQVTHTTLTAP